MAFLQKQHGLCTKVGNVLIKGSPSGQSKGCNLCEAALALQLGSSSPDSLAEQARFLCRGCLLQQMQLSLTLQREQKHLLDNDGGAQARSLHECKASEGIPQEHKHIPQVAEKSKSKTAVESTSDCELEDHTGILVDQLLTAQDKRDTQTSSPLSAEFYDNAL